MEMHDLFPFPCPNVGHVKLSQTTQANTMTAVHILYYVYL